MRLVDWFRIFHNEAQDTIWHKAVRLSEDNDCEWHVATQIADLLSPPS